MIAVIDPSTRQVTQHIAVGRQPRAIAFLPDSSAAYVTNVADNTVSIIATDASMAPPVTVGPGPVAVVIPDDGTAAYVADLGMGGAVSVIDTATHAVTTLDQVPPAFDVDVGPCPVFPTPTPAPVACTGDCNGNHQVSVNELIIGVNIALGNQSVSACRAFDPNGDGQVVVTELIRAVGFALNGCPAA
jgi:DNA-binding beta-propeller fold protein YncE